MKKHLLVTVSNDIESLQGVQFLTSFFSLSSEHSITLLHICKLDGTQMQKNLLKMWDAPPDQNPERRITVGARRTLEKARHLLAQSKMSIDEIKTKTVIEQFGKVKDILTEGSQGLYDAIILGRRASYSLQWVFERPGEETAHAIIQDSCFTMPIWICPQVDSARENVLIGLDDSESSFRAVDHVGYIVSRQTKHKITLLHVDNGTDVDRDEMFGRADKILTEHGITPERIEHKVTWSFTVPGSIISEAERNEYSSVAVGLHGQQGGFLKGYNLSGGTTAKLISRLQTASLWICP